MPTGSEYYKMPTETIARVNVLRYLLSEYGLYNAMEKDFTEKDYENMMKNEKVKGSVNVQELVRAFDKEVVIWLMNNTA